MAAKEMLALSFHVLCLAGLVGFQLSLNASDKARARESDAVMKRLVKMDVRIARLELRWGVL